MKKQELPIILNNFNYITMGFSTFKNSIYGYRNERFLDKYSNEKILKPFNDRLKELDLDSVVIKKVKISKNGIYYDIQQVLSRIKDKYSIETLNPECIRISIDKLSNTESLGDMLKKFPNLSYKSELKQRINKIEEDNKKVIRKRDSIKAKIDPKSKRYTHQLNYVDKTHPICEDVEKKAKELVHEELRKKHLNNLEKILNYSKNNFKELSIVPDSTFDIIDSNALALFIALIIKDYALKEKKDSNLYKEFMKYLNNYIDSNSELIENDYTVSIEYNNALGLSGVNRYKISTIVDFVKKEKLEKEEKEAKQVVKETEEYSFFGWDPKGEIKGFKNYHGSLGGTSGRKEKILQEKIDYYNALGYEKIHIGQNSFEGYLGFELDNGIIIIDKIYVDSRRCELSMEEAAAYITTKEEFEELVKMSRSECIEKIESKELNAVRVYHNVGWQKAVDKQSVVLAKR